jgi:hypothetical protein
MTQYKIDIVLFDLDVQTPSAPTNYKRVINIIGNSGQVVFLYFVPATENLGTNAKRTGENVFDIYYWIDTWAPIVDMLRSGKPLYFYFDDKYKAGGVRTYETPIK